MTAVERSANVFQRALAFPGAPAAAFLAAFIFVFEPAEVFRANSAFFHIGFAQLALVLLPLGLVLFLLLALVAGMGPARWQRAAAAALAGMAAALWANAIFFTPAAGILDGRSMLALDDATRARFNLLWVSLIFLAAAAVAYRFIGLSRRVFTALFTVFALYSAWVAMFDGKPWRPSPDAARLTSLSSERNVLVILLDTFQSDFFAEILASEPGGARDLQGFTYFPNAAGPAPTTYFAIPTIHSGKVAGDGTGILQLYEEEVVRGSFVAQLARAGYDALVVNAILDRCPRGAACEHSDALVHGRTAQVVDSAAFLLDLAIFRIAPHILKPAVYRGGAWWLPRGLFTDYAATSNRLLERFARELRPGASAPTVKFLHLYSSHAPAMLDAGCKHRGAADWTRASAIAQDRCAWSKVAAVLAALRSRALYDQTAVVVLADHGAGMPSDPVSGFALGASASPLLLVKPPGAAGPLKTSARVVGLRDIPATVCAWTQSCRAAEGHDLADESPRTVSYPFVDYQWSAKYFGGDAVPFDNRFEIRGPPSEIGSWWRLTHLPAAPVRNLAFAPGDSPDSYGFGWSAYENSDNRTIRWAMGDTADLYLALDPARGARLSLDVMSHPGNPGQRVLVEVNGKKAADFGVGSAWVRESVVLPASHLAPMNRIVFRFSQANPPGGGDPRRLAVLFDNLAIESAQ